MDRPVLATMHALIGNTRTVALIDPAGAIAWAAFPHADDPAVFDAASGAAFELEAPDATTVTRGFLGETTVLETLIETPTGKAQVIDFLPLRPGFRLPQNRLVRIVEGLSGSVTFKLHFAGRPDGSASPELQFDRNGLVLSGPASSLILQTEADVHLHAAEATGAFTLEKGEKRHFVLTHLAEADPDVPEMAATEPTWDLDGTFDCWLTWARRCAFQGVQRPYVLKLAVLLKSWSISPSPMREGLAGGLFDGPYTMLAPVALAAWGWEEELRQALEAWKPEPASPRDRAQAAWLFWALDVAQRSGLIEGTLVTPHWQRLLPMAQALAAAGESDLGHVAGLRAAASLADELMLPGDHASWRSRVEATALPGYSPMAAALGLAAAKPPAEREEVEAPFHADLLGACWAVREELATGGYLQARRLLDKLLLAFTPLGTLPAAPGPAPVPGELALMLWTAAEIYLQGAPAAGRVDLPGDLGD